MASTPAFWMVAGPNGAGKSTVSSNLELRRLTRIVAPLNPDALIPRIREQHPKLSQTAANLKAAELVESEVAARIAHQHSFMVETVLSSEKYFPYVEQARAAGFMTGMIYVTLPSVEQTIARVRLRVQAGGHDVPLNKQRKRFSRTHDNLFRLYPHLDRLYVFDNQDPTYGARLIALKQYSKLQFLDDSALPEITTRYQAMLDHS